MSGKSSEHSFANFNKLAAFKSIPYWIIHQKTAPHFLTWPHFFSYLWMKKMVYTFHQPRAGVKVQLALGLLLPMVLQRYYLPPPHPPPVSNSSCLFTQCQPLSVSCGGTILLYYSKYCTVRLKMFSLFFVFVFMYYLCEKYYYILI